jgi:hypothetical protein
MICVEAIPESTIGVARESGRALKESDAETSNRNP